MCVAISKLWASRLRSISVELPPKCPRRDLVNRPATRRWGWSVLLADFSSFPCLCPHHHPHYRHSSSSHIPSSLSKTIVNPIATIVSRISCISPEKKTAPPNLEKEKKPFSPSSTLKKKKKKRSLSASRALPFSQFSIAIFYIFILFASKKNNHVYVLFRETRLVSIATDSSIKQQILVLVVVLVLFLCWPPMQFCHLL